MQTDLNQILKDRKFIRPEGEPFWQFLKSNDIAFKKSHFPFLSNHIEPKIKPIFDFEEYAKTISRGEALAYLYKGFGKALNYVGPVLDLELEHGFNDHTDRHTLWVSQTGVELLQRSGLSFDGQSNYNPKTEIMMVLVGMTHDLGNLFSRKDHSTYGAWLLTRLFKNREKNKHEFATALNAIAFHEEDVMRGLNFELEKSTPLHWALVIADKMHVGRDRIGDRSFVSGIENGALEDDIHIVLNALIVRSTWYLGIRNFTWHLDFSVDQLEHKFERFTNGDSRLFLPKIFQNMFRSQGMIYRESFAKLFMNIYGNRVKMAAKCVFLMFPHVNEFRIELMDNDTSYKVGSGKKLVYSVYRGRV